MTVVGLAMTLASGVAQDLSVTGLEQKHHLQRRISRRTFRRLEFVRAAGVPDLLVATERGLALGTRR